MKSEIKVRGRVRDSMNSCVWVPGLQKSLLSEINRGCIIEHDENVIAFDRWDA